MFAPGKSRVVTVPLRDLFRFLAFIEQGLIFLFGPFEIVRLQRIVQAFVVAAHVRFAIIPAQAGTPIVADITELSLCIKPENEPGEDPFVLEDPAPAPATAVTTTLGTFTVDAATNVITISADHGLGVGNIVQFTTSGTLPAGLTLATDYYVLTVPSTATLTVSATRGGAVVDISGTGSGTHTAHLGQRYYLLEFNLSGNALTERLEDLIDDLAVAIPQTSTAANNIAAVIELRAEHDGSLYTSNNLPLLIQQPETPA